MQKQASAFYEGVGYIRGAAAQADWKKGLLTVSYADTLDDDLVRRRVEKAGYRVTGVL